MHRLIKSKIKSFLKNGIGWTGDYSSWQQARQQCLGYEADNILEKVKDAVLKVKNGEAAYERDSVIFDEVEYSFPLLSALLWVALKNNEKLHVADFGGSLGSTYFQNKRFLDGLKKLRWRIIEQPNFVECGQKYIADEIISFHTTLEKSMALETPDILIISCVLQYIERPYELIRQFMQAGIQHIIIDNTPFNYQQRDRITVQKVPPAIYTASYPCWFLNYEAVKKAFEATYNIVTEYLNDSVIELDGRKLQYKGFLMELK